MAVFGSFLNSMSFRAMAPARPFVCVDATSEGPKISAPQCGVPLEKLLPGRGGLGERGNGHDQFN